MALMLPPNWCLIFFRDPEAEFTPARMKRLLLDRGLTVTGKEEPFTVRWGDGPPLYVAIHRGSYIETIIRGLVGRRRKHRKRIPGCDTEIQIVLSDIEEVLDEINTLIEVQSTLQDATHGLMYLSWNHNFVGPDD
ncbi:MAG: hypothetical protein L0Z62_20750 [Gemmataceae bacterium]|nr:hypothetical protein [Gemmataceae bacterium]